MILGTRLWGGAKPTAADYVQDGLVALFDGVENAGWGQHEANATTWKNLATGDADTFTATPQWLDNALALDGTYNTSNLKCAPQILAALNAGAESVEVCVNPVGYKDNGGVIGFGNNATRGVWAWTLERGDYLKWWSIVQVNNTKVAEKIGTFSRNTLSIIYGENTASVLFNAEQVSSVSVPRATISGDCLIGRIMNYNRAICDLHSIRVYDRQLTAEEMAHNYRVDQIRFLGEEG